MTKEEFEKLTESERENLHMARSQHFSMEEVTAMLSGFRKAEMFIDAMRESATAKDDREVLQDLAEAWDALQLIRERVLEPLCTALVKDIVKSGQGGLLAKCLKEIVKQAKKDEGKGDEDVQGTD